MHHYHQNGEKEESVLGSSEHVRVNHFPAAIVGVDHFVFAGGELRVNPSK